MFCPRCNSLVAPGAARCVACGLPAEMMDESPQSVLDGVGDSPEAPKVSDVRIEGAPLMPYEPRGCQLDIIRDIATALDAGRHFVMESGTGTGKTVVSLAAALDHADRTGKTVVYLTRTISQSDQVMRELRAIRSRKAFVGVAITGRGKSCPHFRSIKDFDGIPSNVLSMMCEDARRKSRSGLPGRCVYYDNALNRAAEVRRYVESELPTSGELDDFCTRRKICPYEAKKAVMKEAKVVAAPYVHVLDPDIRDSLMTNLDRPGDPRSLLIIVDEAHNLVDAARDSESFSFGESLVENAMDECSTFRSPVELPGGVPLKDFLDVVRKEIHAIASELVPLGSKGGDAVISEPMLEDALCRRFGLTRSGLDLAIARAIEIGESRTEALVSADENRVSDIQQVAEYLRLWCASSGARYVRTVKVSAEKGRDRESLHARCIDPVEISGFLNSTGGTVHMSGTLEPLVQYVKVLRLSDNVTFRRYGSPFPPENRLVVYTPSLSMSYDQVGRDGSPMFGKVASMLVDLCNAVRRNTIVFFTSYAYMRRFREAMGRVSRTMYWEESGNAKGNDAVLRSFRAGRDGVLCCVMGGKFAEGVDFPGDELCFAVVVGIPFPPPSPELDAMRAMFDKEYPGKGWEYCNAVPAQRKVRQAVGRLIRSETDRGMAVILDGRAQRFEKVLEAQPSDEPVALAREFFARRAPERATGRFQA